MNRVNIVKLSIIDIKDFFNVQDGEEDGVWQDSLRFEKDGIYYKKIKDATNLHSEEFKSIYGVNPDFDEPILHCPCTLEEFERFVQVQGLYGTIDPFTLAWTLLEKERHVVPNILNRRMNAILIEIENQGFNALDLPEYGRNKPGAKSKVKEVLLATSLFTDKGFEKAWEELLANKSIQNHK
jgi:hypothetical protein